MTAAHQLPTIAPPSELLRALSTIGLAWSAALATTLASAADAVDEQLELGADGLFRSPFCLPFAPDGMTLTEALGMTCVVRWAEMGTKEETAWRAPVRLSPTARAPGSRIWFVTLPGTTDAEMMTAREGIDLLRALLVVRSIVWPAQAWLRRDPVAQTIELHLRAMEAELRGPAPVVTLTPAVNRSDLGRDWS
jgi:hypothetical protein